MKWTLSLAVACCAAGMILAGCNTGRKAEGKLQIMFSGNLRGNVTPCGCSTPKGGVARWASFINRHQDPDARWLTVDAGNYVDRPGAGGGCSNKCQFMITSYKDLHYDVLNIGKQETWMGYDAIRSMIDTTRNTQFVSANLVDVKSHRPIAKPTVVRDYGDLKVGIIGLLSETDFPAGTSLLDSTHFVVLPHREAARKYLPSLARKTDMVVLLAELSSAQLDTLLKEFPEVDVVISTGALKTGEQLTTIHGARIISPGSSGYSGHCLNVEFGPDSTRMDLFTGLLTAEYDEAGPWADRLAQFQSASGAGAMPTVKSAPAETKPTAPSTSHSPVAG